MISELNGETRQRRGTGTRHAETRFTLTLSSCFRACFSGFVYGLSLFPSISVLTLCFKPLADDIRTSPDQLPTSNSILWYALCTPLPFIGGPFEFFDKERNYLDVRDATEAHARALEIEEAGGQRFILAAGTYEFSRTLLDSSAQSILCTRTDFTEGPVNWHEWGQCLLTPVFRVN